MRKSVLSSFLFLCVTVVAYIILENIFFDKYSIDTFIAINEILFCGFLSTYLCNSYLKIKCRFSKHYNKKRRYVILLASFFAGCAFTYALCGLISLGVFAIVDIFNPHRISSWNQEWNSSIPLFMGLFSSIIIVAFYNIALSEKIKREIEKIGDESVVSDNANNSN